MLSKNCPHCHNLITLHLLREHGLHREYLARKAIACPHCQKWLQLPASAEKLISVGLLFSAICAPLLYYWFGTQVLSIGIFVIGVGLLAFGISSNKPYAVEPESTGKPEQGTQDEE